MRSVIYAQERPARNVLTAAVNCVNPTRKLVAGAARSSAHHVFSFIEGSIRSLLTGNVGREKGPKIKLQ